MKSSFYLVFFILFLLLGCASNSKFSENRTLLKEYAYCKCFEYATKDTVFFKNDISLSVYKDIAHYYPDAYKKVDSLAKLEASEIMPSLIADYQNKKAIFSDCFLFFKSKKLDSLVKSLDKRTYSFW